MGYPPSPVCQTGLLKHLARLWLGLTALAFIGGSVTCTAVIAGLRSFPCSVSPEYSARTSRFTGKIHWVQIDTGEDDHDHLIDPDERLRIAMARQ